jgi:hypothetical protein
MDFRGVEEAARASPPNESGGAREEAATPSRGKAVVLRLDAGGSDEPGDYRCLVQGCNWQLVSGHRGTPQKHVKAAHQGMTVKTERAIPSVSCKRKTDEELRAANRRRVKRHRARKKVRQPHRGRARTSV